MTVCTSIQCKSFAMCIQQAHRVIFVQKIAKCKYNLLMFLEIPQITEQFSDKIYTSDSPGIPLLSKGFQNQSLGTLNTEIKGGTIQIVQKSAHWRDTEVSRRNEMRWKLIKYVLELSCTFVCFLPPQSELTRVPSLTSVTKREREKEQ